jgi:hypothetical protein
MQVVSYLNAITTIPASWEEIRPIAGMPYALVVNAIKGRYKFQNAGVSVAGQQVGLTTPSFQTGQFEIDGKPVVVNQIEFQPTGIVVSCATSDDNLKLIADVIAFLGSNLNFRAPAPGRTTHHMTTIISNFDSTWENMFGKWTKIQALLASLSTSEEAPLLPLGVRFIGIKNEQAVLERQFVFERRVPSPPKTNWIFSQLPFENEVHLRVLNEIEKTFSE